MSEQDPASDFFDLKMLPAWVKESPDQNRYADFTGEESTETLARPDRRGGENRDRRSRPPRKGPPPRDGRRAGGAPASRLPRPPQRVEEPLPALPKIEVRFLPDPRALENVLTQIKSEHLAYSVFSLARMFLEKPERYNVRLKSESAPLFQLGENGVAASNRQLLERGAFASAKDDFYRVEVVQSEPIKGNFSSVARDRASGTLLGPTNHHAYQQKLRNLYEQRYSRRMSFADFQRQIEVVGDPAVVEQWKEEARRVTTFTTLQEEPALTFQNAGEAERHFRQQHLDRLLRESRELTVDGVASRRLPDRALGRLIENSWAQEIRSPAKMMQELIAAFPANGLHLFRHRKASLFVAPVRPRPFSQGSVVSPTIAAIVRALTETSGMNRKQLLEKVSAGEGNAVAPEEIEKKKLGLASNLRWLISEGHVIEFNDGTLELARAKSPPPAKTVAPPNERKSAPAKTEKAAPTSAAAPEEPASAAAAPEEQPSATIAPNDASNPPVAPDGALTTTAAPNDDEPRATQNPAEAEEKNSGAEE